MKYPLVSSSFNKDEITQMKNVIKSDFFSMGPKVKKFEKITANYFGSKYCVMVNSGSSANLIALSAVLLSDKYNLNKGDEVIVPSLSWSTTYSPLFYLGLVPRYVDISLDTLNISINKLEKSITKKTRAIFIVNITGNPNYFDKVSKLCKKKNILFFEDNCESMGAKYNKQFCGTFGLFGTMSTFFSHHISTMEGGIVLTDSKNLYDIMLSIRSHGWTRHLDNQSTIHKKSKNEFDEMFNFILPGFNLRPIEMEGAIGISQMKKLNSFLIQRRKNAKYFLKKSKEYNQYFKVQQEVGNSSWFSFTIILCGYFEGKRSKILKKLKDNSIETRPICGGNFTKTKAAKYLGGNYKSRMPNTEYVHNNGFFIGNTHNNLSREIDYFFEIIDSLK